MTFQPPVFEEWVLEGPEEVTSPLLMLATVAEHFRRMEESASSTSSDSLPHTPTSPHSPVFPNEKPHGFPNTDSNPSFVSVEDHFAQSLNRFAIRTHHNQARRTTSSLLPSSLPSLSPKSARRHQPYRVARLATSSLDSYEPPRVPSPPMGERRSSGPLSFPTEPIVGESVESHFARSLKVDRGLTVKPAIARVPEQRGWGGSSQIEGPRGQNSQYATSVAPPQLLHAYGYGAATRISHVAYPQGVYTA